MSSLAEAMWWLGDIRESLECWERAYSGFRRRPDPAQAASVAIQLAVIYDANFGNHAAAAGWVARAARLVDEHALEPLRGWVLIARATDADPGQHEAMARQAHQLGRTSGDRHLELCALTQIGVALIDQGRITEGMRFHDEAMAGALAGEGELDTVIFTACEMMDSYSPALSTSEWRRGFGPQIGSSSVTAARTSTRPAAPTTARCCSPPEIRAMRKPVWYGMI